MRNDTDTSIDPTDDADFDALREQVLARLGGGAFVSLDGELSCSVDDLIGHTNPFILRKLSTNKFIHRSRLPYVDVRETPSTAEKVQDRVTSVLMVGPHKRAAFITQLKHNIDTLREAFLLEFAPLSLGFPSAVEEAIETLNLITDADVKPAAFTKMREAFDDLVFLKFIHFSSALVGLDKQLLDQYVQSRFQPKPQQNSAPINQRILQALASGAQQSQRQGPPTKKEGQ